MPNEHDYALTPDIALTNQARTFTHELEAFMLNAIKEGKCKSISVAVFGVDDGLYRNICQRGATADQPRGYGMQTILATDLLHHHAITIWEAETNKTPMTTDILDEPTRN